MGSFRDAETGGGTYRQMDLQTKPNTAADAAKSFGSKLAGSLLNIADTALAATPMGAPANAVNMITGHMPGTPNALSPSRLFAPHATQAARYQPQTETGRVAGAVGAMLPNAAAPGGIFVRGANVFLPAMGSEGLRAATEAAGGNPVAQGIAQTVGGLLGAGAASVRGNALSAPKPEAGVNVLARRGKPDVAAMRAKAGEMRAAGVQPTLIDVAGNQGRRLIRAVGVKNEQAGETLQNNAQAVTATTKPAIMERTRNIGPMKGKTADELVGELFKARGDAATADYRDAYATPVKLDENILRALSDEPGKAALRRARSAAVARMDDQRVQEIDSILNADQGPPLSSGDDVRLGAALKPYTPPPEQVSAATLDRARIAMRERAKTAAQRGARDMASGLNQRVGMIDKTLEQVPELGPARADYRAKSQAIGVLGKERQDLFSTEPASYARWLEDLPPEAQNANKVAVRQEILDTLGGQRSSTFGSVDELATSEYAKANLRHALGAEAEPYIAFLNAKLEQMRNASFVSPNAGSRTAVLENDLKGVVGAVKGAVHAARGGAMGMAAGAAEWLMSRGVSDADAQALAKAAVDPAKLNSVLGQIEGRYGPAAAKAFLSYRNAAMAGAISGAATSAQAAPQKQRR